MSASILALVLFLAGLTAGVEDPQSAQEKRKKIQELFTQADQETRRGNTAEANRLLGEAWAMTAQVYQEEGKLTAASEAWSNAKRYGYSGTSPGEKRTAPVAPQERPQEEAPRLGQPPPRKTPGDRWSWFALSPYHGLRNNAWHALFNTPPMEEALVLPKGLWSARLMLDISSADWSSNAEGGESSWHTASTSEVLEVNYGLTNQILVGLRVTMGELGQGSDDPVRVFEGGQQIVPAGERSFGVESIVGRAKFTGSLGFVDAGVLGEVKVPIAGEEDLLTAQTIDIGLSGIVTKRWRTFAVHLNLGVVIPTGNPDLFTQNDDANPYLHGGLGAAWLVIEQLALISQVEFNTSALSDVTVLDENSLSLHFGGRYKVTGQAFLSAGLGFGLTEESGDLFLSSGIDITF
jgi:hypothetical protein